MDDHAGGPRRVVFLADTHSAKADGSDLPDEVLEAFAGVNPGSPNLPVPGSPGGVAVLDLLGHVPQVDLVTVVPAA